MQYCIVYSRGRACLSRCVCLAVMVLTDVSGSTVHRSEVKAACGLEGHRLAEIQKPSGIV